MSKAIISEKAEPRELKALFIVGPDNDIDSEISKLYDREDCLIIGDGTNPVKITEIYKTLQILNLQIGANTRIDISAHGTRSNKEHKILLDQEYTKTKDFLISLQQLLPNNPLYIHLWSCYGGTANKDIEALNIGSIVVTHIKSSYLSSTDLEKFIRIRSLTRYMNENSLSPYLQYLYDQLENYQGATFSQIESERHIVKFKTIRTPQDYSITTRISNILQINITEEKLTKEIQNYLEIEGKNFCELFKNYISIRDIGKFHEYISNVDNENTRDFISGTIIGLIDSLFNLDIKLKNETTKALNNILDNLKPELINHSIGITPLFIAIHNKNSEIAQTLLEKGADPHFVEADGESLLYIACVKNLVGIANLLLEKGANPNIAPKNNYTPLMAACTNQSLKMVEILLEKGAKINEIDSRSFTPLIIACSKNSEGIAKFLLENGADPNLKVQKDFVPLIIACSKNSEGIVSHLLKKNADPNIVDRNGVMPLLVAYKNRSVRIMELLLEKGANPDVINRKTGTTLLYSAYNEGNVKIFQLLINHKANPNLANIDGTTPLMATCKKGDLETAILLLKHGANINEYNVKNDTPLRLACKNGNLELVKMLVEMELI